MVPKRQKRQPATKRNAYGLATIYIPKADAELWPAALERAERLNQTRSQYILTLTENDLKKSKGKL